jgi:hypothetical protein
VWPVLVVMAAVDAEDVLEVAAAEDEDPVEAVGAERSSPAFGVGVRVRRLDRCPDHSSPSRMKRLRACWVTQRPSGFELEAMYSIRRVASEMKNNT